jgi:photosystem II stability/assembly factor-like uncharacterized protein
VKQKIVSLSLLLCALFLVVGWVLPSWTAFTYQGNLNDGGNPANGAYDLQFTLYVWTNDTPNLCAGPIVNSAVGVTNGLFTTTLDFGSSVFNGNLLLLEIGVRTNGSTNAFIILSPQQILTPVPYAIFANTASNLSGSLPASQLSGTLPASAFAGYTSTVALTNNGNIFSGTFSGIFNGAFTGAFSGNGTNLTNLNASQLTGGTVADARLTTNVALLNGNQSFTGSNIFRGANTFTGTNTFIGINTFTNSGSSFVGSFFGNGLVGWIVTNGTAVQAEIDHGYLLTNSQLATVTLPASPTNGDIVRISGAGAGGWKVAQNSGQAVLGNFSGFGNSSWTASVGNNIYNWYDIASSADGITMVAVVNGGTGGGIYTSTDSGKTWYSTSASSGTWSAVASSANGSMLAATRNGSTIYTSTNAGSTWVQRTSGLPGSATWTSIASSADGTELAAASGSGIYVSVNSGASWSSSYSGSWSAIASSADGTKLVATVNGGGIYINSGGSWSQTGAYIGAWSSVASSADGTKLVAAQNTGSIYTSSDSGTTWVQRTNAPTSAAWTSVTSSSDGGKLAATVNSGGIYTSLNWGATWTQQPGAPNANWSAIASSADGSKLAAVINNATTGGIYSMQASTQTTTTLGASGGITGGQGTAVELQYIGNGLFMPVSSAGTIWGF